MIFNLELKQGGKIESIANADVRGGLSQKVLEYTRFICDKCGCVFDVDISLPEDIEKSVKAKGFQVDTRQLFLRGRCPQCAKKPNMPYNQ